MSETQWNVCDVKWEIKPDKETGIFTPEQTMIALLMDIRETAKSIKGILQFFMWLTIISLALGIILSILQNVK